MEIDIKSPYDYEPVIMKVECDMESRGGVGVTIVREY